MCFYIKSFSTHFINRYFVSFYCEEIIRCILYFVTTVLSKVIEFEIVLKIFSSTSFLSETTADTWLFVYKLDVVVYFGSLRGIWTSLGRPCQITWPSKARPSSCVQYTRHTCHLHTFSTSKRERDGDWVNDCTYICLPWA